ncbi:dimethylaniline monooxygenase [N-oxide-forming] 2-like [Physella acuta]|uniref:dimethylaniline monooxygenase [N-oxide-forming] 2-like n=1 Tax=Physella acuta TaxID=109671 RepID=UPI0027DD2074|nr:dimethylaniline monooxygenase [N-oxide-forming] 2-like [Physella acuta]
MKECLNEGFKVTCYELDTDLGGIWREKRNVKHPNTPQIWENLITNTSKYMMTYSDFPPLAEDTPFFKGQDVYEYYKRYAKANGILPCIQFNTRVIKIRKTRDHEKTGQWEVFSCPASLFSSDDVGSKDKSKDIDLDKCQKLVADFVLICSGLFK